MLTVSLPLWQAYHTAHLEAIKGFGMHGYEMEFELFVKEYQVMISLANNELCCGFEFCIPPLCDVDSPEKPILHTKR